MNNKKNLIIILLVFVLLLFGASALYTQLGASLAPDQLTVQAADAPPEASPQASAGEGTPEPQPIPAPDFTVYDKDGKALRLSDYAGKPVVLNFWASWCGPCQMEMPDFDEKYREMGEEVAFLMVNMTDGSRETVEKASSFVEQSGYTFPVLYDTDSSAAATYGVYSLPTTYFISAEGHAVARAAGAIDGDTLQRGIDML